MKHIVHKLFINYEKEEKWLNEMASKGLALINYSWLTYTFDDCEKDEYIYRIELLDEAPSSPKSVNYINFMEGIGAECVASYGRWVYFRKKSSEGAFNIYSDIDSRISLYQRVNAFWYLLALIEFGIGAYNIFMGTVNRQYEAKIYNVNFILGTILIIIGIIFIFLIIPMQKKIKKLQKEKIIRE